jgi:hypothetical protein
MPRTITTPITPMTREAIVLRNSASDEQARTNAGNSMVLRNQEYNTDFPGANTTPIITSNLAVAISSTITGTGIAGASIKPYFGGVLGTPFTVPVTGIWTFVTSAVAGSYTFTQTVIGQPVSPLSRAVVTS